MTADTVPPGAIAPLARGSTSHSSVDLVIECMRGLAALWVFLFHIADMIQASLPALYPLAAEGYRGVPVFFAISGYCIFAAAQNALAGRSSAGTFLARRLKRIYPTFWVSIVVVMLMPYLLELVSSLKSGTFIVPDPAWKAYSAADWFGVVTLGKELIDGPGNSAAYTAINTVYWSLAIEVQFYLVVFVAVSLGRHWAAVIGLVSLLSLFAIGTDTLQAQGVFLHLWPGFLCGVLVRLAHTRQLTPSSFFGRHQLPASLALLCVIAAGSTVLAIIGGIGFIASAVIASALIWCLGGIEHALTRRRALSAGGRKVAALLLFPLVLLGQSSYSLYLLHGKVHQLPDMVVRQLLPATSPLYAVLVVFLTSLLCYVFYFVIERRFHNRRLPAADTGASPVTAAARLAG